MRFQFYAPELAQVPKLSVDGTVDNSVHFSHWQGNTTPAELKADTSTEIALNLVASPRREDFTQGIELVTNNHFDTDGTLSVWTALTGEAALDHKDILIAAAEAGDFSEFHDERGVKVSIAIQGVDQASGTNDTVSPLARYLSGENEIDEARSYDLVLPEIPRLLKNIDQYEELWRDGWSQIVTAMESFERRKSTVEEFPDANLSLIHLAPEIFSASGFNPTRHAAPYMAISKHARGHLFIIATPVQAGWSYRLDYPYYSWAETVVRPRISRRDLGPVLDELNHLEAVPVGLWMADDSEMTSAAKFLTEGVQGTSRLSPEVVAQTVRAHRLGTMGASAFSST